MFKIYVFCDQFSGPEGTEFNSRGRAALREAHGLNQHNEVTLKGSHPFDCLTLSGSMLFLHASRGLRAKPLAHGY
jgi:hypothetical protein